MKENEGKKQTGSKKPDSKESSGGVEEIKLLNQRFYKHNLFTNCSFLDLGHFLISRSLFMASDLPSNNSL
jgi:hypothetical protein